VPITQIKIKFSTASEVQTVSAQISVTIKTVPHTEPQKLIDLWSKIVLKELLRREQEEESK
jgi:hypothetical protein